MDGEDVIEAKQLAVSDEAARPARDDAFWETTASSVRAFSADAAEPSRPSATSGAPDPSPGPPAASVPATLPPATLPDGLSSAEGGTASSVPQRRRPRQTPPKRRSAPRTERARSSKAATAGYAECSPRPARDVRTENRWSSEPLFPGLDAMDGRSDFALAAGPHACEVLRPSAFTVTGIAQDSHPHSPRQARSARPPVPPPTQPSLPFVDQV